MFAPFNQSEQLMTGPGNHMSNMGSNTVYDGQILAGVYQAETQAANKIWQAAQNPGATGVIPGLGFAQNILNNNTSADPKTRTNLAARPNQVISQLTGQAIPAAEFHQNQVPFIGGGVRQNINSFANESKLEHFTGSGFGQRPKKMETASFFDQAPNAGRPVFGNQAVTTLGLENRFHVSQFRQGEKPFQDIKVGPALNAGFGTMGQGGFQQANALEFARAGANRTINNRLPNNPRISYGRPLNPGALPGGTRGLQAAVKKNRPDKWYRNTPDRYFVTTGAVTGATLREKVNAKATRRQNHRSYYGGLGTAGVTKPKKDPSVRKSRRNNFMTDGVRNAYREGGWTVDEKANGEGVGDYGAKSIENRPNERDITQLREHRLNVATNVKKLIAPLSDLFRRTRKENVIGNIRPEGNMSAQMPSKLTIYDPEDIARTTRKELNIHNEHEGFVSGPEKPTVYDPEDVARTTRKELNIHNEHEGFLSGPDKSTVYDPEDVARTTRKEQNIHNEHEGFLRGPGKGKAYDPEDIARTTVKEMNIHNKAPHINLRPQQPSSLRIYDPEDIARTTMKELTEDKNHMGFMQYPDGTAPGGYLSTNVSMRNTHKQFTSDYYYTGIPDGEVGKGSGRGYLAASYKARNTNKQFTSDYEYTGSAGFYQGRASSYGSAYNARLNPNKEEIARGREPTQSKEKLTVGGDFVNINHKKLDADRINIREPAETFVYTAPPQKNMCGMTMTRQTLPEDTQRSRIDPDILTAFRENPYTQSLTSSA